MRVSRGIGVVFALSTLIACGRLSFESHEQDAGMSGPPDLGSDARDFGVDLTATPMPAGVVVNPTFGLTTSETGSTATFTIVLESAPTASVVVALSSSDETEGTVSPASVVFTQSNWDALQTVTITGADDALADANQSYFIATAAAVSGDPRYDGIDVDNVWVTNIDDETAGVTLSRASGLITTENGGTDSFTVVLNTMPSGFVVLPLSVSDAGEVGLSANALTFTPTNWSSPQTVTVTGVDDALSDGDQAFVVVTGAIASPDAEYAALTIDDVAGVNLDDEQPGILPIPVDGLTTTEGGGTATFTVVLQSRPTMDVTVPIASSDITEGTPSAASLLFTTTNWDSPHVVTVTGVDDSARDGNQSYVVRIGPAASADSDYAGLVGPDVDLSNTDDESPGLDASSTTLLTTSETGASASRTLRLRSMPSSDVTLHVASSRTSEGTVAPADLTFTPMNWNAPQTITVTGVDDALADGNQDYEIVVSVAASLDTDYASLTDLHLAARNTDNDSPGVYVTPLIGLVTSEAFATATFTVELNSQPLADVAIGVASDRATEGTASPALLTFTTSTWNVPQVVTVTGVDDSLADGPQLYHIVTAPTSSADPNYASINPSDVTVTNTDDDVANVIVTPTAGLVTTEAGGAATFTVVLSAEPAMDVTLSLTSSNALEGTVAPASITFTSGNWNVAQTVTVTGVDDFAVDGSVAYSIVTSSTSSGDPAYSGLPVSDVAVSNTDNDVAGVMVTPTSGLVTTEAGGTASFTIVLLSRPTASVTIGLTSSAATEGTVSPSSITFTTLNWNTPRTIVVTGVNDLYDDGDKAYNAITGAASSPDSLYNAMAISDVSITNTDDDTAGFTFVPVGTASTTEDGGSVHLSYFLNAAPSSSLTVTFTVSDATEASITSGGASNVSAGTLPTTQRDMQVSGVDDVALDGDVAYQINTSVTGADPAYNGIVVPPFMLTNLDNDSGDIIVSAPGPLYTTEYGGMSTFYMALARAPTATVTVDVSSNDATEAIVSGPTTITFTTVDWASPHAVAIQGVADGIVDGDQTPAIITAPAVSADASFNGINPVDQSVIVLDRQMSRLVSVMLPQGNQDLGYHNGVHTQTLSVDGRYDAFDSISANHVASDTNGFGDVFLCDRLMGVTSLVSVSTAGTQGNGVSDVGSVSSSGRFVVFQSVATNLVAGDTNGVADIFVRDTMLNTTVRASLSDTETELNGASANATITSDGRYVVFGSDATNAVASDTNSTRDVFVRDLVSGTTTRVSVTNAGAQGTAWSDLPSISSDGRYVAFYSGSTLTASDTYGGNDIFVRDTVANTTTQISMSSAGVGGNGHSTSPRITPDGRYVAFVSSATNLEAGDTNNVGDAFVRDTMLNTTTRVSYGVGGAQLDATVTALSVSNDGQRIAFASRATNGLAGDTNNALDAFVRDRLTATTIMVSTSPLGEPSDLGIRNATSPSLSGDGHTVTFSSESRNIVGPGFTTVAAPSEYAVAIP